MSFSRVLSVILTAERLLHFQLGQNKSTGLYRVPADGGDCTPITAVDENRKETQHTAPEFLPDGRHFLYLRVNAKPEESGLYIGSLDKQPAQQDSTRLLASESGAIYAPAMDNQGMGYLLYRRGTSLMARRFNPSSLAFAADAVPVADYRASSELLNVSASRTGILAFRGGAVEGNNQLAWFDRGGKLLERVTEIGLFYSLALSPDGKQVAYHQLGGASDLWIHEFDRKSTARVTFHPAPDGYPIWSAAGDAVVFGSIRNQGPQLFQKPASGAGEERALPFSGRVAIPLDFSRNGRFFLYNLSNPSTGTELDLWVSAIDGKEFSPGKPFLKTEFRESQGKFSPDSRYIAYTSNATGRSEIYVRPFAPDGSAAGQWMVSTAGGVQPRWSRDGKELFYISAASKLVSVPVTTTPAFRPGTPSELFPVPLRGGGSFDVGHYWDVAPDGKKFLFNIVAAETHSPPIVVVQNWQAELPK